MKSSTINMQQLDKLNNKTLQEIKKFITHQQTWVQYVPPDNQQINAAEHSNIKKSVQSNTCKPPKGIPNGILVSVYQESGHHPKFNVAMLS